MSRVPTPGDPLDERRSFAAVSNALFKAGPLQGAPTVGRYFLLECLGEGGMGVVYSGLDPKLDRKVAIKFLRNRERGEALIEEGRALANLDHPNVVTVHEVGEDEAGIYLVMAHVEGQTLDRWIAEHEPSAEQTISLLRGAGEGLAAVHRAGLTHRDVKPGNILVDAQGHVRLADFGLAVDATLDGQADGGGGTRAYMSPEQARGQQAGPASDQFSFCVVVFEALNGALPKFGDELQWSRAVPNRLRRAVERGLAPEASDRHSSVESLLAALQPPTSLRSIASWAGVATVVGITGLGIGLTLANGKGETQAPDPCANVNAEFDEQGWTSARRDGIADAQQIEGWKEANVDLASYAQGWRSSRTAACREYHGGSLSDQRFDATIDCLDQLGREFELFVGAVESTPDLHPRDLWSGISGLRSVSLCEVPRAVLAGRGREPSEDDRLRSSLLRSEVEGLRQRRRLGLAVDFDRGSLEQRAREIEDWPLRTDVFLLLGATTLDRTERSRLYTEAKRSAIEGEAFFELATAYLESGKSAEFDGQLERAGEQFELADASLSAVDALREEFPELGEQLDAARSRLALARGNLARRSGDLEGHLAFQTQAVSLLERCPHHSPIDAAITYNNLGEAHRLLGDFAAASKAYGIAVRRAGELLGAAAPIVLTIRSNRASVLLEAGDWSDARSEFESIVAAADDGLGTLWPLLNLTLLAEERGDWEEAGSRCEAALGALDDQAESQSTMVALTNFVCINQKARHPGGDLEAARASYDRAVADPAASTIALVHIRWAETLLIAGALEQAQEPLELARTATTLPDGSPSLDRVVVERVAGDLASHRGDPEAAAKYYREAMRLLATHGVPEHPRALAPLLGLTELGQLDPKQLPRIAAIAEAGDFRGALRRRATKAETR